MSHKTSVEKIGLDRRSLLKAAGVAGLGSAVIATDEASAAPNSAERTAAASMQEDGETLVIVVDGSPTDLDPHSAYDYRSVMPILGS